LILLVPAAGFEPMRKSPKLAATRGAKEAEPPAPYVLKPKEQKSINALHARMEESRPLPRQIVSIKNGVTDIVVDHPDTLAGTGLAMEALGLTSIGEYSALVQHVADLTQKDRKGDEAGINRMLVQIAALEPRDSLEAMLATQMVAVHQATMRAARLLRGSDTIPQQDSNSNVVNKLARTFATQVEALKRYRSKGEQKVVVEHVTVNEGGQAIVGAVQQAGGGGSR
jgi:hypothetical protein